MKHIKLYLIMLCLVLLALTLIPSSVSADGGDDVILENYTVSNVVAAFDDITHHGEWLGFNRGAAPWTEHVCTGTPADFCMPSCPCFKKAGVWPLCFLEMEATREQHFQGIPRSPRTEMAGQSIPPYLYVTRAGDPTSKSNPTEGALWVVEMPTRNSDGERLRSNRLQSGEETNHTAPSTEDHVIYYIEFNKSYENGQLNYHHPGGIQMVGDLLAVTLDNPNDQPDECDVDYPAELPSGCLPKGKIAFFDASNPLFPNYLGDFGLNNPYDGVGAVGITRLTDGHYFAVVFWDDHHLTFFRSNTDDFLVDDFEFKEFDIIYKEADAPNEPDLTDLDDDGSWRFTPEPQSLNFVNQADGRLYLIGAFNDGLFDGKPSAPVSNGRDIMILWEVTINGKSANEWGELLEDWSGLPESLSVYLDGVRSKLHDGNHSGHKIP